MTREQERLKEAQSQVVHWRRWGPYLSERQWGTVREDYSENGNAWDYFPHDHARSRAYRWGEDGLFGISDNHQRLCFALALWNGQDPILKERLFGLANEEGNHGEDVKECYYYLDNTPTHSYFKALYKYPQNAFPYSWLVSENRRRGKNQPEFELIDTGVFNDSRYFDVSIEYAKAAAEDILIRITAINRGSIEAALHLLPTLWFRNTWSWYSHAPKPSICIETADDAIACLRAEHATLGPMWLTGPGKPELLFTENETNGERISGAANSTPYVKDGINRCVVGGDSNAVNPAFTGTKVALHYHQKVAPGASWELHLRLSNAPPQSRSMETDFDAVIAERKREADEFYNSISPANMDAEARNLSRQAFAGMLWNKQFYRYVVHNWLQGDGAGSAHPANRRHGRNRGWDHFYADDILSMPDKWEYPWFASWDLAFHCIPLAMIDPDFAKRQLLLLTREWYMHPNGQLPAYEWAFEDANPPVHAWAAWRVYKIEEKMHGRRDLLFLERVFQKLLMNFTWWVNRKDSAGRNIFQGGFLGLDNIGIFDRSRPLPEESYIEQSDCTSWMAMYSLNLMRIAIELAHVNPSYEDIASKFFEHFLYIAHAMNYMSGDGGPLWDKDDGFFYDHLHLPNGQPVPLKIRSLVGLIPIFAVEILENSHLFKLPDFTKRVSWFMNNRTDLAQNVTCGGASGVCERRILSIVTPDQLRMLLARMLDEEEFLSPYGIRSLSRYHKTHPYEFRINGGSYRLQYEPSEAQEGLFGGNSNWRGPVWMPLNFLMIESLQKFHHYLGNEYKVECPTGSGQWKTLWEVSLDLSHRLLRIFLPDGNGRRPVFGRDERYQRDPNWQNLLLFHEYFDGDEGTGLGASHQTGWTGLVAKLLHQRFRYGPQ